jgi:hypothetical protein
MSLNKNMRVSVLPSHYNNNRRSRAYDTYLKEDSRNVTNKPIRFTENDFPELCSDVKNTDHFQKEKQQEKPNEEMSFIEKIKHVEDVKIDVDEEYERLRKGSVLLKFDKNTRKTIIKSKSTTDQYVDDIEQKTFTPYEIAVQLGIKYERYKQYYIDMFGYDEWDYRFRYQNYDYEYFDKLDLMDEMDNLIGENDTDVGSNCDDADFNGEYDDGC